MDWGAKERTFLDLLFWCRESASRTAGSLVGVAAFCRPLSGCGISFAGGAGFVCLEPTRNQLGCEAPLARCHTRSEPDSIGTSPGSGDCHENSLLRNGLPHAIECPGPDGHLQRTCSDSRNVWDRTWKNLVRQ